MEEFDAFYTLSFTRLVGKVDALIGDRDEAQDCFQEPSCVRGPTDGGRTSLGLATQLTVTTGGDECDCGQLP